VLLPPINGATAVTGTPYFTENPGDPYKAWDASATFDYMPSQYITFRWEFRPSCGECSVLLGEKTASRPRVVIPVLRPRWCLALRRISSKDENRFNLAILVKF